MVKGWSEMVNAKGLAQKPGAKGVSSTTENGTDAHFVAL